MRWVLQQTGSFKRTITTEFLHPNFGCGETQNRALGAISMKETTTPLAGDTPLVSDAPGQIRLAQDENQTAAPETPAAEGSHDEDSLPGNPPVGDSEQEPHGDNEAAPPENSGDEDQNGEDEESSLNDTPPATNEDAGQGDGGTSQDPLGLSEVEAEELEIEVKKIPLMTLEEITSEIKRTRKMASEADEELMLSCSRRNVVCAFRIGKMLEQAKSAHKAAKTKYLDWLNEEFVKPEVMSVRTAQRYVQLVKRCDEPEKLVKEVHGLRDAYQKAGIIRPFDVKEASGQGGKNYERTDLESLMKGLLDSQKILRTLVPKVCGESKSELQPEQVDQLRLIRTEINGFIEKLLGETVGDPEPGNTESGDAQDVGKPEEGSGDDPPSDPLAPGASAKSNGGSTTHLAMGQVGPDSKKPTAGKRKSDKPQTPATASK